MPTNPRIEDGGVRIQIIPLPPFKPKHPNVKFPFTSTDSPPTGYASEAVITGPESVVPIRESERITTVMDDAWTPIIGAIDALRERLNAMRLHQWLGEFDAFLQDNGVLPSVQQVIGMISGRFDEIDLALRELSERLTEREREVMRSLMEARAQRAAFPQAPLTMRRGKPNLAKP